MNGKLVEKLDNLFSRYIRKLSADTNGYVHCCTCRAVLHWAEADAGHYISRKHKATRWDEENVYPQCQECNRYKYGNIEAFEQFLGERLVAKLKKRSKQISYLRDADIRVMIDDYKQKLERL